MTPGDKRNIGIQVSENGVDTIRAYLRTTPVTGDELRLLMDMAVGMMLVRYNVIALIGGKDPLWFGEHTKRITEHVQRQLHSDVEHQRSSKN